MSEPTPFVPSATLEYSPEPPRPVGPLPRPRYWLHALLLTATVFTTLVVGARLEFNFQNNLPPLVDAGGRVPFFPVEWALAHPSRLLLGVPFAGALLLILLAHEMGHYLFCRYYGVWATLPFFIPAPTMIGTLGAVIRIRSPIRSRKALFDIGIAGPVAGFVVAIATLAAAMMFSKPLGRIVGSPDIRLGFPPVFYAVHGALHYFAPERAVSILPLSRVYLHPMAIAAWVGMYATALNLLPSGQLDGGHIVYALAPRAHRLISWMTVLALVSLGAAASNYSWWVWAGLITVMNVLTFRQEQAPERPLIPSNRWVLAALGAVILVLTFTRSPFQIMLK